MRAHPGSRRGPSGSASARAAAAGVAALALFAPVLAQANATPSETCQASQLAAASSFMKGEFKCWSSLHKSPAADPGEVKLLGCLEKADAAFAKAYLASLTTAGAGVCGLDAPLASVLPDLQAEVDTLAFAVVAPGFTGAQKSENSLVAALQKAIGNALSAALKAESKDAKQPDEARRLDTRAKARSKLLESLAKALGSAAQNGFAYAGPSAGSVADEVDRIADELAALTAPPGTISFTLSGTIRASDGSVTDSDVNDTNTLAISNSTPALAQEVPVPAVVGGYVNLPGEGANGHSKSSGDVADFYRVSLTAGQLVNLRFGDPAAADLELCLYAASDPTTPLDCSVGFTATEQLSAPSSGSFLVEVYPDSDCHCASAYVLTLGQALPAAGPTGARLSDEFAEGELVVTLASNVAGASAKRASESALEASFAMSAAGGAPDREMLFQLPDTAGERSRTLQALGAASDADSDGTLDARFEGLSDEQRAKLETLLAAKLLNRREDVALAEPNFIRRALTTPNDPHYPLQWHYPLINLPAAWDITTGSASVKVAVIDTGVLLAHPDLQGQLSGGFDFIASPSNALDGNGIDANPDDPGDGGDVAPSSYHGTHVAGTIGAKTQNDPPYGVAGVAWNVSLVPLRVLGLNGGTDFDVLQAVRYAAGLPNNSGTTDKVDVINLSLGGSGFSQTAQNVFAQARAAGVIVVAAAGNEASSALVYPASYEGVVSVSAVDLRRQQAWYSSFGPAVDVAAPGGDTSSDRNGDGYGDGVLSTRKEEESGFFNFTFLQGTSMAAPHVAGVAALMKAVKPTLSPAEFDTLLAGGSLTTDLGAAGRDDVFGHGLIDARKAVEAASASPPGTSPILLVSPTGLNLGTAGTQASFQISNGGGGSLSVTSVSESAPWLTVAAASVDANGLGSYQVSVDRTGLAAGTYSASIGVQTSTGGSSVSVVMAVVTSATSPNAGFHYVLLMDPETLDPVAQAEAAAVDGHYDFAFSNVPAGSYMLFAGSDADNDFFICGAGEACGAYPTFGSEVTLEITSDRSDLDFVTGFLQSLSAADAGADAPAAGGLALPRVRSRQLSR